MLVPDVELVDTLVDDSDPEPEQPVIAIEIESVVNSINAFLLIVIILFPKTICAIISLSPTLTNLSKHQSQDQCSLHSSY